MTDREQLGLFSQPSYTWNCVVCRTPYSDEPEPKYFHCPGCRQRLKSEMEKIKLANPDDPRVDQIAFVISGRAA